MSNALKMRNLTYAQCESRLRMNCMAIDPADVRKPR